MTEYFARRSILVGDQGEKRSGEITLSRPSECEVGKFFCFVNFYGAERFNRAIYSSDEISVLENAIVFVNSICNNSRDPEFFWENGDSMLIVR
jgi:hypothetical protein